jgi:hypothetical protein
MHKKKKKQEEKEEGKRRRKIQKEQEETQRTGEHNESADVLLYVRACVRFVHG